MSVPETITTPNHAANEDTTSPAPASTVESNPLIPVIVDPRVCAWPPNEQTEEGFYAPLVDVLDLAYRYDAHFAAYSRPDRPARLKNEALPLLLATGGILMVLMVLDVDCEESHRTKVPAPDSWFAAECKKLERLEEVMPGLFVARSRGGYRIVLRLAPPFPIRDDADRARWTLYYRRCCAYLARMFGIVSDPACADWTREFRVPHATREPEKGPEERDVYGNAAEVGLWNYSPEPGTLDDDIAIASALAANNVAWRQRVLQPLSRYKAELTGTSAPARAGRTARPARPNVQHYATVSTASGAVVGTGDTTPHGASAWLAAQPPAVEGDGGDAVTYKAALGLVKGFGLSPAVAFDLLVHEYNPRCSPLWSRAALEHKVRSATKASVPEGYLLHRAKQTAIIITTKEWEVVDQAEAALAANGALYQRGGQLVDVVRDARELRAAGVRRPPNAPRIREVALPRLREEVTRVAILQAIDPKGVPHLAHPPKWLIEELAARGRWQGVPHLEGVVETPILRPDGSVLQTPGYDQATGVLFIPSQTFIPVDQAPTPSDARAALAVLQEPFADFPFAGPEHLAAAIAAQLTMFSRYAFSGPSPAIAIDAPTAGTGKSLLADTLGITGTGRPMARMSQAPDEAEERKRITAIAIAGDPAVLLDNVTRPLGSGALDAALTSEFWHDRVLGTNRTVTLPLRVLWLVTANNLQVNGDTARRVLNVRLDARTEHPEQRTAFRHPDLLAWVRQERARLVHAALTLLRAFFFAGAPATGLSGWGSYEDWSRVVRGAVVFAGLRDPAETRSALRGRADAEVAALSGVLEGLETLCGADKLEAGELVDRMYASLHVHGRLHAALLELRPLRAGQVLDASAVGYTLRRYRERVVGGKRLTSEKVGDRQRWYVERVRNSSTGGADVLTDVPSSATTSASAASPASATTPTSPASSASTTSTATSTASVASAWTRPPVLLRAPPSSGSRAAALRDRERELQRHFDEETDVLLEERLAELAAEEAEARAAHTGGQEQGVNNEKNRTDRSAR